MAALRLFHASAPPRHDPQLYARVPEFALNDSRLTGADLRILGALTFLGRLTFPKLRASQREVANAAARAERTVRDSLPRLEAAGYLRRERDYSTRGAPVTFVFLFEYRAPFTLSSEPEPPKKRRQSACNRRESAACKRRESAGHTMYESLEEREKDARPPPPFASGDTSTPAGGEPPGRAEIIRLLALAGLSPAAGPSKETLDARAELRRLDAAGQLGDMATAMPHYWPGERPENQKPAAGPP